MLFIAERQDHRHRRDDAGSERSLSTKPKISACVSKSIRRRVRETVE
jgi:hypothetical protein